MNVRCDSVLLIILCFILGYTLMQNYVTKYNIITDEDIERESFGKTKQIIYFSSPSCPHCTSFNSTWKRFVQQYMENSKVKLRMVSVGKDNGLIEKWNIDKFPTILAIDNDKLYAEFEGPRTYMNLVSFLNMFSTDHRLSSSSSFSYS